MGKCFGRGGRRRGGWGVEVLEARVMLTALPGFVVASDRYTMGLVDPHTNRSVVPQTEYGGVGDRLGFIPYGDFIWGINSAVGDVTGDGVPDIVFAPAAHGQPLVLVVNAETGGLERTFYAYSQDFWGGVNVAVGDVNGDGKADIITAPASGAAPLVNVFDGATGHLIRSFYAYETNFHGGVTVAAADVNGDGKADIVTGAGFGGGPRVEVFSGAANSRLMDFYAFTPAFRGGVVVAAGDLEGNGHADLVVGVGYGAAGNIRIFSGTNGSLRHEIVTHATIGVSIALMDFDFDGLPDIVTSQKGPDQVTWGGGIYKGSDFAFLGNWGTKNNPYFNPPFVSATVTFDGHTEQVMKDRYLAHLRESTTDSDFAAMMGSVGVAASEVAVYPSQVRAYAFSQYALTPDQLAALGAALGGPDPDLISLEPVSIWTPG